MPEAPTTSSSSLWKQMCGPPKLKVALQRTNLRHERLMAAFQREMGSEPDIGVRLINDSQCPVLEFVKGPAVRTIFEGAENNPITDRFSWIIC